MLILLFNYLFVPFFIETLFLYVRNNIFNVINLSYAILSVLSRQKLS